MQMKQSPVDQQGASNINQKEETNTHELMVQSLDDKVSAEAVFSKKIPGEGFAAQYDSSGDYIAIGCNNGMKILFSNKQNKILHNIQCESQIPVTTVKWRPDKDNSKTKVLGIGNSEGVFQYMHVPSMKKLFSIQQSENCIHCVDFAPDSETFATAGKDASIRVYDQNTKSITTTLGPAEWNQKGHSNRIFSIKFIDENTIVSGGWDSVIHQWDLRAGKSVKQSYGSHVAGDSIDYCNGQLLIGSYADKNQIQIWDFNTFKSKQNISWKSIDDKDKVAYVFSSCFSPNGKSIVAGASGINEVKLLIRKEDSFKEGLRIHGLKNGCFSLGHHQQKDQFCFTTAQRGYYAYKYYKN